MQLGRFTKRFLSSTDGALTAFGLYLTVAMICVGGLAIDVANAIMMRTHLQVAADAAAHAAIVAREYKTEAESKTIGMQVAAATMPSSKFGVTIEADDIKFGSWDATNEVFTISAGSDDAVMVDTKRIAARSNAVGTYFLSFVGLNSFDVVSQSVFETYYPTCFREGFVAQSTVDIQSNNTYANGFCIHSNSHVEVNNGNAFQSGVIVSMPDVRDLVIPSDGFNSNPGLASALRDGSYRLRVLQRVNDIINGVDDPTSAYFRNDYVTWDGVDPLTINYVTLDRKDKIDNSHWVSGAIHEVSCNAANQKVTIPANEVLQKGVLITNCKVSFGSNSEIRDIIVVTTNTADDSINAAAGFTVGQDDGCAAGGGAQLITLGGMNFPSNLQVYGGQLIAVKTIDFAARANGIEGVSMVSGDRIDGTSLMNMGFCGGSGMENNFQAEYFRLAI